MSRETPMQHIPEFDSQLDTILSIEAAMSECDEITKRSRANKNVTQADALRTNTLLAKISLLKQGVSADAYRKAVMNNELLKSGRRPLVSTNELSPAKKALVESYRKLAQGFESRDVMTAGQGVLSYPNGSGSTFIPTLFIYGSELQQGMRKTSSLFDENVVTFVKTETGAALQLPTTSDTDDADRASIVNEATVANTYTNIARVSSAINQTYLWRTPAIAATIEWQEDALASVGVDMLHSHFAQRMALGVGHDFLLGVGGGPTSIFDQIDAAGGTPVTAAGSASDDGGAGTGVNSIGSQDLRNLFHHVDAIYRSSEKCAFVMADSTLLAIEGLRDKQNQLLNLIRYNANGAPVLFGKPVHVDPYMPLIGASQAVVLFGDFSRYMVRYVPSGSYVQVFSEIPGFAENGEVAWRAFGRFGAQLLSGGAPSNGTPIAYLRMHS